MTEPMTPTELDGKKARFLTGHPHAGETGTIIGAQHTAAGWGLYVKLDNCQHGTEACFLFKPSEADVYSEPMKARRRK